MVWKAQHDSRSEFCHLHYNTDVSVRLSPLRSRIVIAEISWMIWNCHICDHECRDTQVDRPDWGSKCYAMEERRATGTGENFTGLFTPVRQPNVRLHLRHHFATTTLIIRDGLRTCSFSIFCSRSVPNGESDLMTRFLRFNRSTASGVERKRLCRSEVKAQEKWNPVWSQTFRHSSSWYVS